MKSLFFLIYFYAQISGAYQEQLGQGITRSTGCDLSKTEIPELAIYGEVHDDINSVTSRKYLVGLPQKKSIPVMTEGISSGSNSSSRPLYTYPINSIQNSRLHGLESDILYAPTITFGLIHSFVNHGDLGTIKELINGAINTNQHFAKEITNSIKQTFPTAYESVIKNGSSDPEAPTHLKTIDRKKLFELVSNLDEKDIGKMLNKSQKSLIAMINSKYFHTLLRGKNLIAATGYSGKSKSSRRLQMLREDFMAFEIAKHLCSYSGITSQIPVVIGAVHMCGIRDALKKFGVPERKIKTAFTFQPVNHTELMKASKCLGKLQSEGTVYQGMTTIIGNTINLTPSIEEQKDKVRKLSDPVIK